MNLSELLRKDLVRKVEPDGKKAKELLVLAERDIKAAGDNLVSGNGDWALAIAYNAMLSAGRALMSSKGYAPVSEAHHLAVVQFCAAILPESSAVATFNRYRVRRHEVMYGEAGSVGTGEARNAIENAKMFLVQIKDKVKS
jgi:uncharacterized protein (UPF0332 family)